jgi:hypothetical protein
MERMSEESLIKVLYLAEKVAGRRRGRLRTGWMIGIENILKDGVRSE